MHAYIALRLATGIRTEKARALRWKHVDFGIPTRNRPCRQAQRCGAPCGPMGPRRPRNRAGPLLYLVGDAHRLDHSSADELVFAARGRATDAPQRRRAAP